MESLSLFLNLRFDFQLIFIYIVPNHNIHYLKELNKVRFQILKRETQQFPSLAALSEGGEEKLPFNRTKPLTERDSG